MIGNASFAAAREEVDVIVVHLGGERRALRLEVGNELAQRRRIEHRARQHVRAGLARLLEHGDRQRLAAAAAFCSCASRSAADMPGRAAADDQDVDFEGLASMSLQLRIAGVSGVTWMSYFFSSAIIAGTTSNRSPTMP